MASKTFLLTIYLFLMGTGFSFATLHGDFDFPTQVRDSFAIFRGTVVASESRWKETARGWEIVTDVSFAVTETFKGPHKEGRTLEFAGGSVGNNHLDIAEMPKFTPGEDCILFLTSELHPLCPLVGWNNGRSRVEPSPTGLPVVALQKPARDFLALMPRRHVLETKTLPLASFRKLIQQALSPTEAVL